MIISFAHKGLENFYRTGSVKGIQPMHADKLRKILKTLDNAPRLTDINLAYKIHRLKGEYRNYYAIRVDKNYRLIFQFTDEGIELINYLDYH